MVLPSSLIRSACYWEYISRDRFVHAPSQWEATLQCNIISHWLGAFTKLSLYIHGLVQDCSNSSALAMELLQSCTKPLIWVFTIFLFPSRRSSCSPYYSPLPQSLASTHWQYGRIWLQECRQHLENTQSLHSSTIALEYWFINYLGVLCHFMGNLPLWFCYSLILYYF